MSVVLAAISVGLATVAQLVLLMTSRAPPDSGMFPYVLSNNTTVYDITTLY